MKEHNHATIHRPETKPVHDEVAKKVNGFLKKDRPEGREMRNRPLPERCLFRFSVRKSTIRSGISTTV